MKPRQDTSGISGAKRILIAGSGSGCGKTTAVCGLLYGLRKRGLRVGAWKCGPDFIDPMFYRRILGTEAPVGNLDLFFSGEAGVRHLLEEGCMGLDIAVVEGAMGYYDGIGMTEEAGCYALARAASLPVILVIDPAGMGNSVGALLQGFLGYRRPSGICGALFNRVSRKRYEKLKPLAEQMGIRTVGFLPPQDAFVLESRHLGLVTAQEIADFDEKLERFYARIADTVDWSALLQLASGTGSFSGSCGDLATKADGMPARPAAAEPACRRLRIGLAKDEAFCFFYEDNLRYLQKRGCEMVPFSPLRDRALPDDLDGLILCGGYPELYGAALAGNVGMRESVRSAVLAGLPCIAECGGFLYLQKSLRDTAGMLWEMAGVLPGNGRRGEGLERFGYVRISLHAPDARLFGRGEMRLTAHEFHYYDCDMPGDCLTAKKASGDGQWTGGIVSDTLYAGFPHIYFYGNEPFAEAFLERASLYQHDREEKGT